MESRKIQKVGVSTLTISLPKSWAETQGLQKGDQVFMQAEGDSLRLMAPEGARRRLERPVPTYVIDADALDEPGLLERVIVGNYVLGRERLLVKSAHRLRPPHLEEIRTASHRLMGLGIIEETGSQAFLQCSLEPSKFPVETLVKRLYNLGASMLKEAIEALITKDRSLAESALHREDDADMVYWLLIRLILSAQQDESLISKLGMESRLMNAGYRLIAKELETVADCAEIIAQNVLDLIQRQEEFDWPLIRTLREGAEGATALYGDGLAALFTRDLKLANRTVLASEKLEAELEDLHGRLLESVEDPHVLLALRTIASNLARVTGYAHSIARIAINRYLERASPVCKPVVTES